MATDSVDSLEELANRVDEEFDPYRGPDEFKQISLVIDSSRSDRSTLIVHIDGEDASSVADSVEEFLTEYGASTQREYYSDTDIRILTTVD